jgi:GT2 family glycosyltransferase
MFDREAKRASVAAEVCACLLIHGQRRYFEAGYEVVRALLERSDFDLFIGLGPGRGPRPPRSKRAQVTRLDIAGDGDDRASGFLGKFAALEACLAASDSPLILMLDADAVLVSTTSGRDVRDALGTSPMAMVEQTGIRGSEMDRAGFLDHYLKHSLAFIAPDAPAPEIARFRFFNSGVVIMTREEAQAIAQWARDSIASARSIGRAHHVGEHMIADQDYFQVWANTLHPDHCRDLDGVWNHCEHWDDDFPRPNARILHFSNFCDGPTREGLKRIRHAARGASRVGSDRNESHLALPSRRSFEAHDDAAGDVAGDESRAARLGVVIVSHDSAETLASCLAGIAPAYRAMTVVVDNASRDTSVEIAHEAGVQVLPLNENLGFGRAATLGARSLPTSLLCFLNPDCEPTRALFEAGVAALQSDPSACAAPWLVERWGMIPGRQPGYTRTKLVADILENHRGQRMARLLRTLPFHDDASWSWAHGACFFIGREFFDFLDGFDEDLFLYMEDVDLGRRIAAAGGRVVALPERVVHHGGRGTRLSAKARRALLDAGRFGYARRVYGRGFEAFLRSLTLPARARRTLRRKRP